MQRSLLALACFTLCATTAFAQLDDRELRRERFFEARVRPLLIAKCYECHSDAKQESGLRLDSRSGVLRGGDSGPAAIVRDPAESLLMQAVLYEGLEMPPDAPLEDEEVEVFNKWIMMGLPWPKEAAPAAAALGDQVAINKIAQNHWAFQPIQLPAIPQSQPELPTHNPIDAFVNAKLTEQELSAVPPADRRTLIRRATMDVIGLPPTPDEIAAFVNDKDSDSIAFDKVIDRLLASKHYGERWGRYWLDLARYADTQDWQAQADIRYPFAYTYRDYVIRSLNEDKPYDRFVAEQIAADSLGMPDDAPELAALGFITVGPRFRNDRLERAADQIDVVTRGLMGLTVACARCHDHKYDPIPIEDYYSLYGVMASCEVPDEFPNITGGEIPEELQEDFQRQLAKAQNAMTKYRRELRADAIEKLTKNCKPYFLGYYDMHVGSQMQIRAVVSKRKVEHSAMTPLAAELLKYTRRKNLADHPVWGPWVSVLNQSEAEYKAKRSDSIASWNAKKSKLNPLIRDALIEAAPQTRLDLIVAYAGVFQSVLDAWQQTLKNDPEATELPTGSQEAIWQALLGEDGLFDLNEDAVVNASRLLGSGRRNLGDLEKAIGEVYATHPGAPPKAMVITDKDAPIKPYVMLRGEPARRGDQVPRRFVSIIAGKNAKPFQTGSGRADLAAAIVSPENPLTPRVIVNRVWAKYFDRGLAESADDFGLRSPPPSHPELLDWMSAEFIRNGWSLKWLHRTILSSATYQRSSQPGAEASERDPENVLLSHQNRKRIDFEATRDAMLAVSGTLDRQIGGRSVRLSQTPYPTRRTIYAYIDRVELDPMLRVFDFATPTTSIAERSVTTVPQQSLFVMNHPFVVQCARELASLVHPENESETAAAIDAIYQHVLARNATDDEQRLVRQFLTNAGTVGGERPAVWQYGLGNVDRTHVDFHPLNHWSGQHYQFSSTLPDPQVGYARLTALGGNTPRTTDKATIRRWVSPIQGTVTITGKLTHSRDKGDGVIAKIASDALETVPSWPAFASESETKVEKVDVQVGTVIDFIVEAGKSASNDNFLWSPQIRCIAGPAKGQRWDAAKDFSPPPAPQLDGWEQLAQALMLTNEFFYLD
ncbi:PSD1 and planctomycete cytochrome C domain-containing protein [Aporhodopirellula aestuarii]|uniref:PSD1 and planctomycete cytochrome C domain-containing protein n=1 Tax=Aporhodopirellula aestuarii TaxID=2950107 RepID=A0ABT0U629_9BACT|nr:PSD1 and planctomycete cytochrome C domain-containing protein [Aporhodopirellula aestuarii]MCM2372257.1 PSD1 and planctomycete cytochrome C domain-containing protein [Aporhodopirellula aestuarii]